MPGGPPFVSPPRQASPAIPPTAYPPNRETSGNSRQVLRRVYAPRSALMFSALHGGCQKSVISLRNSLYFLRETYVFHVANLSPRIAGPTRFTGSIGIVFGDDCTWRKRKERVRLVRMRSILTLCLLWSLPSASWPIAQRSESDQSIIGRGIHVGEIEGVAHNAIT